jgi:hypothetical protein
MNGGCQFARDIRLQQIACGTSRKGCSPDVIILLLSYKDYLRVGGRSTDSGGSFQSVQEWHSKESADFQELEFRVFVAIWVFDGLV